ncbi:putative disease resistance protein RGA4, partial [Mucuna pruriens]
MVEKFAKKVIDFVGNLKHLCSLDLSDTDIKKLYLIQCKFGGAALNLHKLTNLLCLEFIKTKLGEPNLCGSLSIEELQNIENPSYALAANLKNKIQLVELKNQILDDPRKERKVLENLQPPERLKKLSIKNYGGKQFPSMLFDYSLSNVVSDNT